MQKQLKKLVRPQHLLIAFRDCEVGKIVIAQSSKGLRSILIGKSQTDLLRDLKTQFPNAPITCMPKSLQDNINKICSFIEKPTKGLNLPLDLHGTSFQKSVWKALIEIPVGKTASYKDIAQYLHHPNAIRAVARACARNVHAIVIPCHRVIKSNGELGGYRWGIKRKKLLLDRERMYCKI